MKRPLFIIMMGMIAGETTVILWGGGAFFLPGLFLAAFLLLALFFSAFYFPGPFSGELPRHRLVKGPFKRKISSRFLWMLALSFLVGQVLYYWACHAKGVERELYGTYIEKPLTLQRKERENKFPPGEVFPGREDYESGRAVSQEGLKGEIRGRIESIQKKEDFVTILLQRGAVFSGTGSDTLSGSRGKQRLSGRQGKEVEGQKLSGKCLVTGLSLDVLPGDEIRGFGSLFPLEEVSNPGSFPIKIHRLSQGIRTCFRAENGQILKGNPLSMARTGYQIRNRLASYYEGVCSREDQALLKAMVLGDKSDLSEEERRLYEENGAAHLLSLSGLHVSIVAGRAFRFLRKRRLGYGISCMAGFFFIVLYGLIVSGGSSLVRSSLMFSTFLLAEYAGAEYDMLSAMSLAMILMLAEAPFRLLDGGCLTSFLYIFILGMILPLAMEYRQKRNRKGVRAAGKRMEKRGKIYKDPELWGENLKESLFSSLVLSLAAGPVLMALYYEWAPVSILLNPLILPAMVPLMLSAVLGGVLFLAGTVAGSFLTLAGSILETAAVPLAWPAVLLLRLFHFLFFHARKIPSARIITGHLAWWQILLLYGVEIFFFSCWYRRAWKSLFAGLVLTFLILALPSKPTLAVTMLDVGQGDCILVTGPGGRSLLIDSGSTSEKEIGRYVLLPALKYFGLAHLDGIVITHFDEDHISGIRDLLASGFPVGCLLIGRNPDRDDPNRQEILDLAAKNHTSIRTLARGDHFSLGEMTLQCMHPSTDSPASSPSPSSDSERDRNAGSVVLYLTWKEFDALFTGDIGQEEENEMADWIRQKRRQDPGAFPLLDPGITFLKCAHHGSAHSSSDALLGEVRPAGVGISAGRKNPLLAKEYVFVSKK